MSLADVVRSAVATANAVTKDLQATVTHEAWIGQDSTTKPVYDDPVSLKAIVERRNRLIRTRDGKEMPVESKLTFLAPIAANGAAGRIEPIDPRDKFTLQDGTTGPIARIDGMQDAAFSDGRAFLYEVYLGQVVIRG